MRRLVNVVTVLACCMFVPAVVLAQASITGVVRDASAAVMPGVTVEASSPALIEKVRSVATDGTGQYRIVDLRPGVYAVAFALSGFSTIKRDGVELTGSFVATINAELRVGALAETITVTGESPIVDVQSAQTTRTLDNELIASIPSSRGYQSFTVLQPGLNVQGADVGGVTGALFSGFQAHGGRRNEGQVQVNGLSAGWQGMGVSGYVPEVGSAQEVTFQITGGLGEAATGGPQMNLIPRTGGNTMSGSVFTSGAGEGWQGSNLSQEQIAGGLQDPVLLLCLVCCGVDRWSSERWLGSRPATRRVTAQGPASVALCPQSGHRGAAPRTQWRLRRAPSHHRRPAPLAGNNQSRQTTA